VKNKVFKKNLLSKDRMSVIDKLVGEVQTSILPTMMAGDLVNLGIKLAMEINSDSSLTTSQKVEAVSQALVKGLALEKDKLSPELYTHLVLVSESAVPSSLTAVIDACNGKINLKEVSVKTWLSWFSCVTQKAVSVLASQGVISKEQADAVKGVDAAALVSKVAGALEKVEAVAVAQGVISKEQGAQLTSVLEKVEKDLAPAAEPVPEVAVPVVAAPVVAAAEAAAPAPEVAVPEVAAPAPHDLSGVVVAVDPPQADGSASQESAEAPLS